MFKGEGKKNDIDAKTTHIHVGYLGQERLSAQTYLVQLTNKEEGRVNREFLFNRKLGDYCEMDVIRRLYPDKLHPLTEEQYLNITAHGLMTKVLEELGLDH